MDKDWNYIRNVMIIVGGIFALYNYSPFTTFKELVYWCGSSSIVGVFLGAILAFAIMPIRTVWQERHKTSNIALAYCKALGLSFLTLIGIILCLLYIFWDVPL